MATLFALRAEKPRDIQFAQTLKSDCSSCLTAVARQRRRLVRLPDGAIRGRDRFGRDSTVWPTHFDGTRATPTADERKWPFGL